MKTDLFQSCGHCRVFQMCWHVECSTFTASSFRIWKSSTGILSPPLALLVVLLPNAHLTMHSKMSVSRLMMTPSCLSGSWRSFLYSSSMYSCHLFLISSASVVKVKMKSLSCVRVFVTPWTVAYQAPPSMGFSRQECWSGLPFLLQGIFPTQGSNMGLPHCRRMLYHLSHQGNLLASVTRR